MYCQECYRELDDGCKCPDCAASQQLSAPTPPGSPTLVKGVRPGRMLARQIPADRRYALLGALIWLVAVMVAIPWLASSYVPGPMGPSTSIQAQMQYPAPR
jgi:hypothetical protein